MRKIDADALLRANCEGCIEFNPMDDTVCTDCRFAELIENAPTVKDHEKAHWKALYVNHERTDAGTVFFACDCCGMEVVMVYARKKCHYRYCPNCGAEMDDEK